VNFFLLTKESFYFILRTYGSLNETFSPAFHKTIL
jgi:hypothetical protein